MNEGELRTQECIRKKCEYCDELATYKLTYLLPDGRRNPQSKAYGKDDCSWCQDAEVFVCDIHKKDMYKIEKDLGMEWCSAFPYSEKFKHFFLHWETILKLPNNLEEARDE